MVAKLAECPRGETDWTDRPIASRAPEGRAFILGRDVAVLIDREAGRSDPERTHASATQDQNRHNRRRLHAWSLPLNHPRGSDLARVAPACRGLSRRRVRLATMRTRPVARILARHHRGSMRRRRGRVQVVTGSYDRAALPDSIGYASAQIHRSRVGKNGRKQQARPVRPDVPQNAFTSAALERAARVRCPRRRPSSWAALGSIRLAALRVPHEHEPEVEGGASRVEVSHGPAHESIIHAHPIVAARPNRKGKAKKKKNRQRWNAAGPPTPTGLQPDRGLLVFARPRPARRRPTRDRHYAESLKRGPKKRHGPTSRECGPEKSRTGSSPANHRRTGLAITTRSQGTFLGA